MIEASEGEQTATEADLNGDFLPDLCGAPSVLALILVSELLVGSIIVTAYGVSRFDWAQFGTVSMLTQWVVLCSAACLCMLRPHLRRIPPVFAGLLSYAIVLGCTLIFSCFTYWVSRGSLVGVMSVLVGNFMVAAVLAGIGLRYLYLQQQLRNQQRAEMLARIQALQSRIRPHFLFNSMNTIASLIAVDQDTAERVVVELSQLFRASLSEAGLIPLSQEIDLCRYYIDIEQMRLGERMSTDWQCFYGSVSHAISDTDPRLLEWKIPSFLLQPLVENAIYHGIQPLPEGGNIRIHIIVDDENIEISVRNPLPNFEDKTAQLDKTRNNGIALDNIRHRLHAYYGAAGSICVETKDTEFIAKLRYPKHALHAL